MMINKKLLAGIAILAFAFVTSTAAIAADDVKPSYANKKSGKVVFAKDKQDDMSVDVADIEPAAGAEDVAEEASASEEPSLAEDMKLPRK